MTSEGEAKPALHGGLEAALHTLLIPLHHAMQAALDAVMSVVDEEDAVLLYRCNRLAESCPDLLEACDLRRSSIHSLLRADFDALWRKVNSELAMRVEELSDTMLAGNRSMAVHAAGLQEELIRKSRLAAEMRVQQLLIEKDAERETALRNQAEHFIRRMETEKDEVVSELHSQSLMARAHGEAMKRQATRQVEEMKKSLSKAEHKLSIAQTALDRARVENAALERKIDDVRVAEREAHMQKIGLSTKIDMLEKQLDAMKQDLSDARLDKHDGRTELDHVKADAKQKERKLAARVDELEKTLRTREKQQKASVSEAQFKATIVVFRRELKLDDSANVVETVVPQKRPNSRESRTTRRKTTSRLSLMQEEKEDLPEDGNAPELAADKPAGKTSDKAMAKAVSGKAAADRVADQAARIAEEKERKYRHRLLEMEVALTESSELVNKYKTLLSRSHEELAELQLRMRQEQNSDCKKIAELERAHEDLKTRDLAKDKELNEVRERATYLEEQLNNRKREVQQLRQAQAQGVDFKRIAAQHTAHLQALSMLVSAKGEEQTRLDAARIRTVARQSSKKVRRELQTIVEEFVLKLHFLTRRSRRARGQQKGMQAVLATSSLSGGISDATSPIQSRTKKDKKKRAAKSKRRKQKSRENSATLDQGQIVAIAARENELAEQLRQAELALEIAEQKNRDLEAQQSAAVLAAQQEMAEAMEKVAIQRRQAEDEHSIAAYLDEAIVQARTQLELRQAEVRLRQQELLQVQARAERELDRTPEEESSESTTTDGEGESDSEAPTTGRQESLTAPTSEGSAQWDLEAVAEQAIPIEYTHEDDEDSRRLQDSLHSIRVKMATKQAQLDALGEELGIEREKTAYLERQLQTLNTGSYGIQALPYELIQQLEHGCKGLVEHLRGQDTLTALHCCLLELLKMESHPYGVSTCRSPKTNASNEISSTSRSFELENLLYLRERQIEELTAKLPRSAQILTIAGNPRGRRLSHPVRPKTPSSMNSRPASPTGNDSSLRPRPATPGSPGSWGSSNDPQSERSSPHIVRPSTSAPSLKFGQRKGRMVGKINEHDSRYILGPEFRMKLPLDLQPVNLTHASLVVGPSSTRAVNKVGTRLGYGANQLVMPLPEVSPTSRYREKLAKHGLGDQQSPNNLGF